MAMVYGGDLVARALVNDGVDKAFTLCGGHIMPIFYGLRDAGVEIIDVRHEASAVHAAMACTRATGKVAVAMATAGPGVANTTTAMLDAEVLRMPVVLIGGAVASDTIDGGDLQDAPTLRLMQSICKWARKVGSIERIPEYVAMALRHAQDSSPGPVYLEIPTDLLLDKIDDETVKFPTASRATSSPAGDPELIEEAARLLATAERPAILVDEGARWSLDQDAQAVTELSDFLKMPVGMAGSSCRGQFGNEYENLLLNINMSRKADVLLTIGCRFDYRIGRGEGIPPDAKVIQVHTDPHQIGFNLRADIGLVGGAGNIARQILERLKTFHNPKTGDSWLGPLRERTAAMMPPVYHETKTPTHPARCAGEVARFLEEFQDWNIVVDGGENAVWMAGVVTVSRPDQYHTHSSGANGNIGTGPGTVIGAWAANRKPTLMFTGDGSFGFYSMELETMARFGIPAVIVIANNSGWAMIGMTENFIRPDDIARDGQCNTTLPHMVSYEKMVEIWGGYGELVTDPDEILPAIRRAAANGKPSIVNVEVDDVSLSPFIANYADILTPEKSHQ